MKREDAKKLAPILADYGNGKEIQTKDYNGVWTTITNPMYAFDTTKDYRIKPEPKTIPLTIEDLYEHFKKGTIFKKVNKSNWLFKITQISLVDEEIVDDCSDCICVKQFCGDFTFEDDSPLTKIVEE